MIRNIPNGEEGIAVFEVAGNKMAVLVRAEAAIDQFDQVRVIQGPGNTVTADPRRVRDGRGRKAG